MEQARAYLGVAASGGAVYAIGGMVKDSAGNTSAVSTVEKYDPTSGVWSLRAPMSSTRSNFGIAVATDGKIYAAGGAPNGPYNNGVLNTVEEYDPSGNSWRAVASLPDQRADMAAAGGPDGKIYVFGGVAVPYNDGAAYQYDPAQDVWTTLPSLPHPREQGAAALGPDGRIYVTGGILPSSSGATFVTAVDVFDPIKGNWATVAPMSRGLTLASSAWSGGKLYVFGAGDGTEAYAAIVERYDPTTNSWTADTSPSTPRRGYGTAVGPGGEIYLVGGAGPNEVPLSVVEVGVQGPAPSPSPTATATLTPTPTLTPTMTATAVPGQNQMAVAYQVDPAHDGNQAASPLTLPLAKKWSLDFGQPVSYPLIAGGKIFVTVKASSTTGTNYGTNLVALDASTGAAVWGPVFLGGTYYWSGIAYDDGRVFAVNYDGLVRAFDANTGQVLWERTPGAQSAFTSPPTALQGVVYVGGSGSGGTLYAMSATTGDLLWSQPVANGDHSSPALSDDGVFVSYACPNAYKFDRWSGQQLWFYYTNCSGGGGRTSVYNSGRLYIRDLSSGTVLDSQSGTPVGTFTATAAPAFASGLGFFVDQGTITAVNLVDNTTAWAFTGDGTISSAPAVVGSTVYVGGTSGHLYGLDAATGNLLWSDLLPAGIPAPDENNVSQPLTGLNAGEGLLVVPAGNLLVAYTSGS